MVHAIEARGAPSKGKLYFDPVDGTSYPKFDMYKGLTKQKLEFCENYSCNEDGLPIGVSAAEIFQRLRRGRLCFEARSNLMELCFFRGNTAHRKKANEVLDAMEYCRERIIVTPKAGS